jgi:hypothetical protein
MVAELGGFEEPVHAGSGRFVRDEEREKVGSRAAT